VRLTTESKILAEYRRRTPTSARLAAEARAVLPSGITHDSRHLEPYPVYIERAAGPLKWDVDGNEYVDYTGGHGALLFGHNHPRIVEAIADQLQRGTHFGASHELEVRWAQLVTQLVPSAEVVRFTSSGTEATLLAFRIARAATGRPKIMRFLGHFHGWHDHVAFGFNSNFDGSPTPGVLEDVARQVVLAPAGDAAATERLLDTHPDVAAVIIEPTGASWGQVPLAREFLIALREMTAARNVVLIFDEVISGFRCGPGGAQGELGITPDLTTMAKILAGGLPGGAVAGRRDLLDWLAFPSGSQSRSFKVPHQGTFNANPLSAAAGVAALTMVSQTDACQRASRYAAQLREALNQMLADEGVPWVVYGSYSGYHIFTNPQGLHITAEDIQSCKYDYRVLRAATPPALLGKLRVGMLIHGVDIFSWPGGPTSAVHGPKELQRTVEALRQTVRLLKAEGEIRT
jgi:glutamate-1-semialdehyde 2,1-aminomutase